MYPIKGKKKRNIMKTLKNLLLLGVIAITLALTNCIKEDENDPFILLTKPMWRTDSLLANGKDASQPGQLLAKFKGDAKFKDDGTGVFGIYKGNWQFVENNTQIIIKTDSLPLPLTSKIVELTASSFKITTGVPDLVGGTGIINIRMTFIAK
jgi:hypothetical protein